MRGIIIVYLLLILCNLFHEFPSRLGNLHSIPVSEEWYLIVINRWNEIPEDYRVELTELSNGQKVDSRIYTYLQEMFDAAKKDRIYPVVREGYRTYDEQQKILDDKIKAYINEGYLQSRAERIAKEWVALPGTSEHQLGIAVDINADKSKSSNDEVYTWLAANAHNYGFILRYPQGKQEITGTSYEPWHYRYVGVDAARFDFPSFSFFKINLYTAASSGSLWVFRHLITSYPILRRLEDPLLDIFLSVPVKCPD